jgi:hypothetical protein
MLDCAAWVNRNSTSCWPPSLAPSSSSRDFLSRIQFERQRVHSHFKEDQVSLPFNMTKIFGKHIYSPWNKRNRQEREIRQNPTTVSGTGSDVLLDAAPCLPGTALQSRPRNVNWIFGFAVGERLPELESPQDVPTAQSAQDVQDLHPNPRDQARPPICSNAELSVVKSGGLKQYMLNGKPTLCALSPIAGTLDTKPLDKATGRLRYAICRALQGKSACKCLFEAVAHAGIHRARIRAVCHSQRPCNGAG